MEHFHPEQQQHAARALGANPVRESVESGPSLVTAMVLHGDLLEQVHSIISQLEAQLEPILAEPDDVAPDNPSKVEVAVPRLGPARSPLVSRMANQTLSLVALQDRIMVLLHRVQL